MTIHHGDCGHIKLHWDDHKKCINCSLCSRESTCSRKIEEFTQPERKPCLPEGSLRILPFSSDERKIIMGALPHMAVLAGERPIWVETPWVLVPKGVQVHRATVTE